MNVLFSLPDRTRLLLIAVLALLAGCTSSPRTDQRPNVILIMTDDQGYGDFGATGNPILRTPHLDAMAARSARMTTFYVSPVCSPTRASLMTGRYNYRTRVVDTWLGRSMMDPEEVTLAEILQRAGYRTGIFGKWHLGDAYPMRPQDQGFDEVLVHRGGGIGQPSDPPGGEGRYTDPLLLHNRELIQAEGYCTDVYFDAALNWIEARRRQDEPFFAYIATNAPHAPFDDVPEALLEDYRSMDLSNAQFPQNEGHPLPAEHDQDRRARIFAMITNIDDNIGRLFDRLDALDLTEHTLVIFLNDNGPNGQRYVAGMQGMKTSVYEGGIRTPFWMHWPAGLKAGASSDAVAAHIDVLPTVLDAVGVEPPDDLRLDGRSFLPLLTGDRAPDWPERHLVIQTHRGDVPVRYHHFMIRNDRWKLVHPSGFHTEIFEGDPAFELFDLKADPFEMQNVTAEHPAVVTRLREAYDAWFDDVGHTRPDNYDKLRIYVGTPHDPVTVLTRNDWHPIRPVNWELPEANGFWDLEITASGPYDVHLRFPPSVNEGPITLRLGDTLHTAGSTPGEDDFTFEAIALREGPLRLTATLDDGDVVSGVWQVEITRSHLPDETPAPTR